MGKYLLLLSFALVASAPAEAEIYNCAGTWTNQPCTGKPAQVLPEQPAATDDPAQAARRTKLAALHDLRMKKYRAEQEYDLKFDISDIEDQCEAELTSLSECKKLAAERSNLLDDKLLRAREISALEAQSKHAQSGRANDSATEVTVVQQNSEHYHPIIVRPRPIVPKPIVPPEVDPETQPPAATPQATPRSPVGPILRR
jgi:hypothetical protein